MPSCVHERPLATRFLINFDSPTRSAKPIGTRLGHDTKCSSSNSDAAPPSGACRRHPLPSWFEGLVARTLEGVPGMEVFCLTERETRA